jgi:hypothetical protein
VNPALRKQARLRWRNNRWEVWHPNVRPDADAAATPTGSHRDALTQLTAAPVNTFHEPWGDYPESRHQFAALDAVTVETGEMVWVDEYGTDFEVGNPEDTYTAFTQGGCHIFAAAAHNRTGWPIVALAYNECVNGCDPYSHYDYQEDENGEPHGEWCQCAVNHFYVEAPDGTLWDVTGAVDPEALLEDDPDHHLRTVPDDVFAAVLQSWGSTSQLAGWALQQTDDPFGTDNYTLY